MAGAQARAELRPAESLEEPALTLAGRALSSSVLVHGGGFETGADLEAVFRACGFEAEVPFYEYGGPDGSPQLTLWYNAAAETGVGIRYRYSEDGDTVLHGFGFQGLSLAEGDCRWKEDRTAPPEAVPQRVEDVEEERTYDEAGRLTAFSSSGRLDEPGHEEERVWIYCLAWTYDEGGVLRRGSFGQNPMLFGTTGSSREFFCDEAGRLCYERAYITHGSLDCYYIYEGENAAPAYGLSLDDNPGTWFPEMARYF